MLVEVSLFPLLTLSHANVLILNRAAVKEIIGNRLATEVLLSPLVHGAAINGDLNVVIGYA